MKTKIIQQPEHLATLKNSFLLTSVILKTVILTGLLLLFITHWIFAQPLVKTDEKLTRENLPDKYLLEIDCYYRNGIVYMNWVENALNEKMYYNALWVSKKQGDYLLLETSKDNKEFSTIETIPLNQSGNNMIPLNQLSNNMKIMSDDGNYYHGLVFFKFSLLNIMKEKISDISVPVQLRGKQELFGFYERK